MLTLPRGMSESTFVKIRGGPLLSDGLQDAGEAQKTTDNVIFVLKLVGAISQTQSWCQGVYVSQFPPCSEYLGV